MTCSIMWRSRAIHHVAVALHVGVDWDVVSRDVLLVLRGVTLVGVAVDLSHLAADALGVC